MSYFNPFGGHTSADDPATAGSGRDEPFRARHHGVAPDSYVDDRLQASPPPGADTRIHEYDATPYGYESPVEAPDPYADFRHDPASPELPYVAGADYRGNGDGGRAFGDGVEAYPGKAGEFDGPEGESEPSADGDREPGRRGPGRRRAGRSRAAANDSAAKTSPAALRDGQPAPARSGRAGRNLQAAILVGLSLGAVVVASMFVWPPAFVGVVVAASGIGIWEMARALRGGGAKPPLVPLLAGGVLMVGLAKYAGTEGLALAVVVTVAASMVWRLADGTADLMRDLTATTLIAVYVPFLLAFAVLLIEQDGGSFRVLATLLAVVLSDTGGYAAGVFLGRHPMAPKISPKKSWEGFGGSVVAASVGSAVTLGLTLDVAWWQGALFGVVMAGVAVLGDLTESMMKRDLGIKDMSQLLPGHGGLMDRLDSILFAVPTAYVLLSLIAPPR